jgi:hypothetical protein
MLSREQFAKLREAKRLIKEEFGQELILHEADVMEKLYHYASESRDDDLYQIHLAFSNNAESPSSPAPEQPRARVSKARPPFAKKAPHKIQVGDIVDDQRCVSIYRGKPVMEPLDNIDAAHSHTTTEDVANNLDDLSNVRIGDIVGDRRCVAFYRGSPVMEPLENQ